MCLAGLHDVHDNATGSYDRSIRGLTPVCGNRLRSPRCANRGERQPGRPEMPESRA